MPINRPKRVVFIAAEIACRLIPKYDQGWVMRIPIEDLISDARYYLNGIDFQNRQARFYVVDASLPNDNCDLVRQQQPIFIPLDPLLEFVGNNPRSTDRPVHFIWMTDYCGSTLYAKALNQVSGLYLYNETALFAELAIVRRQIDGGVSNMSVDEWRTLLRLALLFQGKTFADDDIALVKEWPVSNYIMRDILNMNDSSRGIFMYAPLEDYLVACLKKPERRKLARERVCQLFSDLPRMQALSHIDITSLSDAKVAALHWLYLMYLYQDSEAEYNPQLHSLCSKDFFESPASVIKSSSGFFGFDAGDEVASSIIGGSVFSQYSKNHSVEYSMEARTAAIAESRLRFDDEVSEGLEWAQFITRQYPLIEMPRDSIMAGSTGVALSKSDSADLLNPSLCMKAQFQCDAGGESIRTVFDIASTPEVGSWLRSMADAVLVAQGKKEFIAAAEPQLGAMVIQRLISGGFLVADHSQAGAVQLRRNSETTVFLMVTARRKNLPAQNTFIQLAAAPGLIAWLLDMAVSVSQKKDVLPPPAELIGRLRSMGVLVKTLPDAEVCFPYEVRGIEGGGGSRAELDHYSYQYSGANVPPEVQLLLGRWLPRLPGRVDICWGRDVGTGLLFPGLGDGDKGRVAQSGIKTANEPRALEWRSKKRHASQSLSSNRYADLRALLSEAQKQELKKYARRLVESGYFPALDDGQVALRSGIHNEPMLASIHQGLAVLVSEISGERVKPSYSYLTCYHSGAVLERHVDRSQCAYNLSLVLDISSDSNEYATTWPIFLEVDGRVVSVNLNAGDGVLYSGTELYHWREALPLGHRAIICFYHFVTEGYDGSLD
ncbi:MAG: hypothetical protein V7746_13355 [Halioglobus sp.]